MIPLQDLTPANGPTEFRLGSHRYGALRGDDDDTRGAAICAEAGDVVVYDFRIEHRGLPNLSSEPRDLGYLTVAKPWWRDTRNKRASAQGARS